MPLVTFHLVDDQLEDQLSETLLKKAADLYAKILNSPVDRIRCFINTYQVKHCLVAGEVVKAGEGGAPYFEFMVLAGRPDEQVLTLIDAFTTLLENTLSVDRSLIRGRCIRVDPTDWGIAGKSAAEIRKKEIEARKDNGG